MKRKSKRKIATK